jgi:hypothetical protein
LNLRVLESLDVDRLYLEQTPHHPFRSQGSLSCIGSPSTVGSIVHETTCRTALGEGQEGSDPE